MVVQVLPLVGAEAAGSIVGVDVGMAEEDALGVMAVKSPMLCRTRD